MKKFFIFIFFYVIWTGLACAEGKLSLGLGYPYISGKYDFSEKTACEFRFATGSGVSVYSGRFYWNFKQYDKLNIFTGAEAGYVNFNTYDMKGTGYETGAFIGGEYFITPKLSFIMDFYPVLIGLKSDDYKVSGVEMILNAGLYLYFGSNSNSYSYDRKQTKQYSFSSAATRRDDTDETFSAAEDKSDNVLEPKQTALMNDMADENLPAEETEIEEEPEPDLAYERYVKSGNSYFAKGNYANAELNYNNALKSLPDQDKRGIYLFERKGAISLKRKNLDKAKEFYLSVIYLAKRYNVNNKSVLNSYLGIAYCFERAGKTNLAIRNYEKAFEMTSSETTRQKIKKILERLKPEFTQETTEEAEEP